MPEPHGATAAKATERARTPRAERWWLALVLLCGAAFAASTLFAPPLRAPDEIRVAEIGREMAVSGDLIVPQVGGRPFLEQPPLYYAAVSVALRAFGVSDGVARLPSMLATLASMLLAADMARRLAGARASLTAALVLASLFGFLVYSPRCLVDSWLTLFVALGMWAWLAVLLAGEASERRAPPPAGAVLLVYASAALAFLTKGPVGPILLLGPIAMDLALRRDAWPLRTSAHAIGALLLLPAVVCWPLLLWARGGQHLLDVFVQQNIVQRIAPDASYTGGHRQPFWFYLANFPLFLMPWLGALPAVGAFVLRRRAPGQPRRAPLLYLALAFPAGLLLLSLPASKRALYLLPLLMPVAVLTALWLVDRVQRGGRAGRAARFLAPSLFGLALLANVLAPFAQDTDRDMTRLATDLRDLQTLDASLAGYRLSESSSAVVPFRTGRIVRDLQQVTELQQFVAQNPQGRLLAENKSLDGLPAELRARLQVVRSWDFGRHGYSLFAFAAPASATELPPR